MKSRKAVSPVIAVILLIAIAVAASVTVFAYTQGIIGGVSRADLQVTQPIIVDSNTLLIRIQNTGGTSTTIDQLDLYRDGGGVNVYEVYDATTGELIDDNGDGGSAMGLIMGPGKSVSLEVNSGGTWSAGQECTVRLWVDGTGGSPDYSPVFTL